MNYYLVNIISALSIVPAAILILYKRISLRSEYLFFVLYVFASLASEIISFISIETLGSNCIWYNLYSCIEVCVVSVIFLQWLYKCSFKQYLLLLVCMISAWVADHLILHDIKTCNSTFFIVTSFFLLYLFITKLNRLILHDKTSVQTNAKFYIAIGMLLYFTMNLLVEIFYLFPNQFSTPFYIYLLYIANVFNIVANLLFAIAVCFIRNKNGYVLIS